MSTQQLHFLKPKEVAERLQMNTLTIYEYIRNGQLRASKFGRSYRIDEKDLELFIVRHQVKNTVW